MAPGLARLLKPGAGSKNFEDLSPSTDPSPQASQFSPGDGRIGDLRQAATMVRSGSNTTCRCASVIRQYRSVRADLYVESVLAKCDALKRSGIWAPEPKLRPRAWLGNFNDDNERLIAAVLLDNFIFYSERAADQLLVAAFDTLEDALLSGDLSFSGVTAADFLRDAVLTPIEGETPRPTDSGKALCGRLRDLARLDDNRFVDFESALQWAAQGRPIIFVDDFLGSGQQLIKTWRRWSDRIPRQSFAAIHARAHLPAACIAMVATETARRNVNSAGLPIELITTHTLEEAYGAQHLEAPSLTPPFAQFQESLRTFLDRHAPTLTLPPFLTTGDQSLYGFHTLGLLFSFERKPPDATLPVFWAPGPQGWICLVK